MAGAAGKRDGSTGRSHTKRGCGKHHTGIQPPAGGSSGRAAAGAMLRPFKLERYFADYEFSAPHLLCCSDAEALTMKELLELNRANGEAGRELQERWDTLSLGYTESRGDPTLLGEVSGLYEGGVVAAEGPRATRTRRSRSGHTLTMLLYSQRACCIAICATGTCLRHKLVTRERSRW